MTERKLTFASLIAELKERRVFRTVLIYVAVAWLIIQVVDVLAPAFFLPGWSTMAVAVLLVLGLPFAILLSWRFELVGGEAQRQASTEGKAATYIWLTFSMITLLGGSWLAHYSYTQTIAAQVRVHASFGEYAPPDHSIAVLPFVNMSGNPDNEFFAEGLADTVLHRLAQVDQLFVIARTSSFRFKGSDEGIESIGRKLNVGAVLEGSVQQIGNQMRIIAQLVDTRTGKHLQSLTFDASAQDLFSVQDDISLQVTEALEIELLKGVTNRLTASGTANPKAHELYMLGRFHAGKYTPEGVRKGNEYFRQAIELDPDFVLAHVGVADSLIRSPRFEQVPFTVIRGTQKEFSEQAFPGISDTERYTQARDALNTALDLDDESAEAYATLGYLETWLGDRSAAEPLFQKAIVLRPGLADAYYVYGRYLAEERRYAESLQQLQHAMYLDPANVPIIVWNIMFMRKNVESSDAAMLLFHRIAELDPLNAFSEYRNPTIYYVAWLVNTINGNFADAVSWAERELALDPTHPVNQMAIGMTYLILDDAPSAEKWRALGAASPTLYADKNGLFFNWTLLLLQGRADEAGALAQAVVESGDPLGYYLKGEIELHAGRVKKAVEYFDAIPDPVSDLVFFSDELVTSDLPIFAISYAHALMKSGAEQRAEELLLEIQEYVAFYRQQGFASPVLDFTDAQVYAIRGKREETLAALRKTVEKSYFYPLEWRPEFDDLRDDPEVRRIFAPHDQHNAEQLQILLERHRIPTPWSPDYQAAE